MSGLQSGRLTFGKNFSSLLLGNALYLLQSPSRSIGNRLNSLITPIHHQLDITLGEARNTLQTTQLANQLHVAF